MFRRLVKWNTERREWNREHERTWAAVREPTESGLTPFQVMCETAIVSALSTLGVTLVNRKVEGRDESYVTAGLSGTDWTLWIYVNGAEVSSKASALVRMEEWDAKTPEEFVTTFVNKTVNGFRK